MGFNNTGRGDGHAESGECVAEVNSKRQRTLCPPRSEFTGQCLKLKKY